MWMLGPRVFDAGQRVQCAAIASRNSCSHMALHHELYHDSHAHAWCSINLRTQCGYCNNLEMQQQKSPATSEVCCNTDAPAKVCCNAVSRLTPLLFAAFSITTIAWDQMQPACICGKFSGVSSLALENPDCCFFFAPPGLPKPLPPPILTRSLLPTPWPSSEERKGVTRGPGCRALPASSKSRHVQESRWSRARPGARTETSGSVAREGACRHTGTAL